MHTGFWWGHLKQYGYLHDLDADGKNIEMCLNEIGRDTMDRTELFQKDDCAISLYMR